LGLMKVFGIATQAWLTDNIDLLKARDKKTRMNHYLFN
jgi:hypothetical protein